MSVVPVRLAFDWEQSYQWASNEQFMQRFLQELDMVGSNQGVSYELRQHLRNTLGIQNHDLRRIVMAMGRMMVHLVNDVRIVPDTAPETSLESADIEVLVRIFETVGAEIERRGGATPKV